MYVGGFSDECKPSKRDQKLNLRLTLIFPASHDDTIAVKYTHNKPHYKKYGYGVFVVLWIYLISFSDVMGTQDLHSLHYFRSRSLLLTCSCHSFIIEVTSLILVEFMNTCPKGNSSEVSGESLQKRSYFVLGCWWGGGGWHGSECCALV